MSLKSLLMPAISQRLLSRERLLTRRAKFERTRTSRGERHQVHYFHQVDDPYSALVTTVLPQFLARYDVDMVPHVVGPPADNAAPERARLIAYSRRDAQRVARHWGLEFHDAGVQPSGLAVQRATALLIAAVQSQHFVERAGPLSAALWHDPCALSGGTLRGAALQGVEPDDASTHLATSNALRKSLGHYLGATFFYGGEWYWGLDRLHHLERRLQDLGAQRPGVEGVMFAPDTDWQEPVQAARPEPVDFFFSLRSPYSAIVAPRVFEMGRLAGVPIRLRFVLPMVMRGLPVPREKRAYIGLDAAREAFMRGIPFGRLNDPLGRPTERGLALIPFAERAGRGERYVLSFMHGVWAEGIDAGSGSGLRKIAERAGLSWGEANLALKDESWRETAEKNRAEMAALGLWGVPSLRVGDTAVWGQDRLWAIQEALMGTNGDQVPRACDIQTLWNEKGKPC